jgi:hypothetical protein
MLGRENGFLLTPIIVGSELLGVTISATGVEFVGGVGPVVGPDEFPPVIMTDNGGTCTGVIMLVLKGTGATAVGVRAGLAPPTIITCEEGVRTGGATGVGSLVTGESVEPSPTTWPNNLLTGNSIHTDNSTGISFMGMRIGSYFIFSILFC